MALSPRLDLRQSQQLVMTPQLQQAIKLLQLSNLELTDYVIAEVEKNPLLEMAGDETDSRSQATDAYRDTDTQPPEGGEASADAAAGGETTSDAALQEAGAVDLAGEALDTDLSEAVYHHDSASDQPQASASSAGAGLSLDAISGSGGQSGGDERSLDQTLAEGLGLHDFLRQQIPVEFTCPNRRLIAAHLVDTVDEAGYIPASAPSDIAEILGTDVGEVEGVLCRVQRFEPSGVAARSLAECLAIQLAERDRLDPAMQAFLDHLDLVARSDMAALKRCCGVGSEDLADMVAEIRGLNPKPGLAFGEVTVQPVVPDILISKTASGWQVELNTDTLPRVLMNNAYMSELGGMAGDRAVKSFVSECMSNANWLVKALDQRARTILKVASALVKRQEGFFEHGVRALKPMTLKDIADEIDMHESTVSRVTSNKFLTCPRGLFELKYFFSAALGDTAGGDAHSAEAVKYRIKALIDAEDPKKILSDDKIVLLMKAEDIDIARRTVAKYREAMKIPSSVQRRRLKAMAAS